MAYQGVHAMRKVPRAKQVVDGIYQSRRVDRTKRYARSTGTFLAETLRITMVSVLTLAGVAVISAGLMILLM